MTNASKPPHVDDERLRAYLERCQAIIEEHGYMIQSVFASGRAPDFAYTVGLSLHGHAELVIVGLPSETATYALNRVVNRLDEAPIPDHQDIHQVVNTPVRLRTIDPAAVWQHMAVARSLLRTQPETIRQLIWPDPAGRFPGHPAYQFPIRQTIDELTPDQSTH